jgi:hypothetical protein
VALPSISEAFPFALVEAMLTGSTVVASDVGGVAEALGDTGVPTPPRDPAALAEKTVTLLRAPQERARLGAAARARALQSFTEDRFVDAYRRSARRRKLRDSGLRLDSGRRALDSTLLVFTGDQEVRRILLKIKDKPSLPPILLLKRQAAAIHEARFKSWVGDGRRNGPLRERVEHVRPERQRVGEAELPADPRIGVAQRFDERRRFPVIDEARPLGGNLRDDVFE